MLNSCGVVKSECTCRPTQANGTRFPLASNHRYSPCWKHWRIYLTITQHPDHHQLSDTSVHSLADLDTITARQQECQMDRYVVTVKNPVAWIVSDASFHKENLQDPGVLRNKLRDWTDYYRKWFELWLQNPFRVRIVKYESILWKPTMLPSLVGNDLLKAFDLVSISSLIKLSTFHSLV